LDLAAVAFFGGTVAAGEVGVCAVTKRRSGRRTMG